MNRSNADAIRGQSAPVATGQYFDANASTQDVPFEPTGTRRGRGHYGARVFRRNRNFGSEHQHENEEASQQYYRKDRRQHDRQPRSNVS